MLVSRASLGGKGNSPSSRRCSARNRRTDWLRFPASERQQTLLRLGQWPAFSITSDGRMNGGCAKQTLGNFQTSVKCQKTDIRRKCRLAADIHANEPWTRSERNFDSAPADDGRRLIRHCSIFGGAEEGHARTRAPFHPKPAEQTDDVILAGRN
jgi:hypothetical protein